MQFRYEISSKVETLKLDGETNLLFQGKMMVSDEAGEVTEMGSGAIPALGLFDQVKTGDVLVFDFAGVTPGKLT